MLVYRIEHSRTRNGPYNPGNLTEEEWEARRAFDLPRGGWGANDAHPAPSADGLGHLGGVWDFPEDLFFGFASPGDLAAWFGAGFVVRAAKAGFVAAVYYAPLSKVYVGGRQVAFHRDEAHLVRECRTFAELLNLFPIRKEATA